MKDLIQNARAVEARLRSVMLDTAADAIAALITELEAAQEESRMSDDMYNIAVAELEAAQADAAKVRYVELRMG